MLFNCYVNILNLKQSKTVFKIVSILPIGRILDYIRLSDDIELTSYIHYFESHVPIIDNFCPILKL